MALLPLTKKYKLPIAFSICDSKCQHLKNKHNTPTLEQDLPHHLPPLPPTLSWKQERGNAMILGGLQISFHFFVQRGKKTHTDMSPSEEKAVAWTFCSSQCSLWSKEGEVLTADIGNLPIIGIGKMHTQVTGGYIYTAAQRKMHRNAWGHLLLQVERATWFLLFPLSWIIQWRHNRLPQMNGNCARAFNSIC